MKLFATILACTVFFLSTQCLIIDTGEVKSASENNSCCAKKKSCNNQKKETKKKDCKKEKDKGCKKACNPFMACCGCLYDGILKTEISIRKTTNSSVKNGYKEIFFESACLSGVWQPPETFI